MQYFWHSLKMLIFMILLTGVIYPVILLLMANLTMPWLAQGSIIEKNHKVVGSRLIGQQFTSDSYFWGRPSAVHNSTMPAGASNLGPTSAKLKNEIEQRRIKIAQAHNIQDLSSIPIELLCASGSGIDPHISIDTAYFQLARVARARSMSGEEMEFKIHEMILNNIDKPIGKLFGRPYVNVLALNLALDEFQGQSQVREEDAERIQ